MSPNPKPKQTQEDQRVQKDAYNIHQGDDPLGVKQVIAIQTRFFSEDLLWKVLGFVMLIGLITIPYYLAKRHWHKLDSYFTDHQVFACCVTLAVNFGVYIGANLFYLFLYQVDHPFFEQYKDNDQEWGWKTNPVAFKARLKKALIRVTLNNIVLAIPSTIIIFVYFRLPLKVTAAELLSFPVHVFQVFFMILSEDLMFYWSHRTLHTPWFYKNIHKIHHEFTDVVSIASEYAHPVEYILGNLGPLLLGLVLLFGKGHLVSFSIFVAFRLIETVESHGGYELPWAITRFIPMSCTSKYHNYHHLKNIGNFGSMFILWDSFFGTNSHYYKEMDQKGERPKVSAVELEKKTN